MPNTLPIYEIMMLDDNVGIDIVSFVAEAAMLETFVALSAESVEVLLAKDNTKYEVTAPLIIPERLIYRNNIYGKPGYLKFTAQEIKKVTKQFLRTGQVAMANTEHDDSKPVNAHLVQFWTITDPQKDKAATEYGFKNLPAGTLMATYSVEDKQYWQDMIETGKITGLSLQGNFGFVPVSLAAEQVMERHLDDLIAELG